MTRGSAGNDRRLCREPFRARELNHHSGRPFWWRGELLFHFHGEDCSQQAPRRAQAVLMPARSPLVFDVSTIRIDNPLAIHCNRAERGALDNFFDVDEFHSMARDFVAVQVLDSNQPPNFALVRFAIIVVGLRKPRLRVKVCPASKRVIMLPFSPLSADHDRQAAACSQTTIPPSKGHPDES
jgi:hypothetical protein